VSISTAITPFCLPKGSGIYGLNRNKGKYRSLFFKNIKKKQFIFTYFYFYCSFLKIFISRGECSAAMMGSWWSCQSPKYNSAIRKGVPDGAVEVKRWSAVYSATTNPLGCM
jgi:hypothetical protein